MRIDHSHFDEDDIDSVYLLNKSNKKYLKQSNYIFLTKYGQKNPLGWLTVLVPLAHLTLLVYLFSKIISSEWNSYHLLTTEGETTVAILADKQETITRSNSHIYTLHYLYQVDNQTYPLEITSLDLAEFESAEANITILYAASNPSLATADIRLDEWQMIMPRNILIAILVIYLSALAYHIFRKIRLIPAHITQANIVSRRIFWRDFNSVHLSYEFVSPKTNQIRTAEASAFGSIAPTVGQTIAIIYHNENKFFAL